MALMGTPRGTPGRAAVWPQLALCYPTVYLRRNPPRSAVDLPLTRELLKFNERINFALLKRYDSLDFGEPIEPVVGRVRCGVRREVIF